MMTPFKSEFVIPAKAGIDVDQPPQGIFSFTEERSLVSQSTIPDKNLMI